jgi:hypothetical protein
VHSSWRKFLAGRIRATVARAVTQLLIAHEACGAVHAVSVVGGSFARFYVLGGGLVATDLGDATKSYDQPLLSRPGVTLQHLLHRPTLQVSLADEQPELACPWDLCSGPVLGRILPLNVPFGKGLDLLVAMFKAAQERVASADGVPVRPPTILQDVLGSVKGRAQPQPQRDGYKILSSDEEHDTKHIIRYIDQTVRMVPVTPNEMTKLIESARWVPNAMYTALENLTSGFEAHPEADAVAGSAKFEEIAENTEPVEIEESANSAQSAQFASMKAASDHGPAATSAPDRDAWWGEKSRSAAETTGAKAASMPAASDIEEEDPALDGFKLGMAAGTEDALFDPESEFFVSIDGVEDPVFEPAPAPATAGDAEPAPEEGIEEEPAAPDLKAWEPIFSSTADIPEPLDADLEPASATDAEPTTDTIPATDAAPTDAASTTGAAPRLPPHLAALQALYDLEGDVVKTTEVTTKVDVPGMRPPPPRSMGFRGSSGAGPRRPGEVPAGEEDK